MTPCAKRLTIFEKMQILKYAEEVVAKHSEERKATGVEKMKKKSGELKRTWTKGLNVQAVCKQRFPESLGGIKICQLRRQAREQKWAS